MDKSKVVSRINPLFYKGVAHRGLHTSTITENSPSAFLNAVKNNICLELDVHLSKDGQLIVSHDASLLRTTSKEGKIEDLTLQEIKNNYRLLNNEQIPTLREVLDLVDEKVGMVIEIKPDAKKKNYREIARKVAEELKDVKDKKNFIIISFYPQPLLALKHSGFIRLLLVGQDKPYVYHLKSLFEGVDMDVELFKQKKYQTCKKHRLTMCWTIDSQEKATLGLKYTDILTFQHLDLDKVDNRK